MKINSQELCRWLNVACLFAIAVTLVVMAAPSVVPAPSGGGGIGVLGVAMQPPAAFKALTVQNALTVQTGPVSLPSGSIADSALATISTAGKVSDSALSSNVALEDAANIFTAAQTISNTLNMSGSAISNIGAAGTDFSATGGLTLADGLTVSAGTVTLPATAIADAALSANVPLKNAANTFTANQVLSGTLNMSNQAINNIGAAGTDFSATGGLTLADGLTVSSGTVTLPATSVADAALSANVPLLNGANTFTAAQNISSTLSIVGNSFTGAIKYGTTLSATDGMTITHGFATAPTACLLSPSTGYTATVTSKDASTITVATSGTVTFLDWMCGK